MQEGTLYFVKDEFYEKFSSFGLLKNKETTNGEEHSRPCCYLFKLKEDNDNIYWMIPISSKIKKYEAEYNHAIEKYGMCDNISFGYVLGEKRAFLPQNLFPITSDYIKGAYIDKNTSKPIVIPKKLAVELNAKARKKIRYNKIGKKLGMSDALGIYEILVK